MNVIPTIAKATLDSRLLPGTDAEEFLSEVKGIAEEVRPERVDLLYWDSRVAAHEEYDEQSVSNIVSSTKPSGNKAVLSTGQPYGDGTLSQPWGKFPFQQGRTIWWAIRRAGRPPTLTTLSELGDFTISTRRESEE